MKVYIANCTKQEHVFTYMLPENLRPFSHHIRAGAQTCIDASPDDIDCILKQHSVYGLTDVDKVKKGFSGIVYRFDKPISVEAIENGISQTTKEQIDKALEARKLTALASDKIISDKAEEMGISSKGALEIGIVEERKNPADTGSKFEETIEVQKEGFTPRKRGRPKQ